MNRTQTILAEMRADNRAALDSFTESVDEAVEAKGARMRRNGVIRAGGPRYALTTGKGRSDALGTAHILLKGTEDVIGFSNNVRREFSLPRRAMSMCASRGRVTPDMLESLMAFFSNPTDMAQGMLASFLPTKVGAEQAKALLSDPFVVDVIEGLGVQVPTNMAALVRSVNPHTGGGRSGAPGRVHIYKPGVAPTVDPKRRGRPSGPKYVAHLSFGQVPVQGCLDVSGIPGGNDVAHGHGRDQGAGWSEAWAKGQALSLPQVARRNAALDAWHAAAAAQMLDAG